MKTMSKRHAFSRWYLPVAKFVKRLKGNGHVIGKAWFNIFPTSHNLYI
jgi:hypothetical protein